MLKGIASYVISLFEFLVPERWLHKKLFVKSAEFDKVLFDDNCKWISFRFEIENLDPHINCVTRADFFSGRNRLDRKIYLPSMLPGTVKVRNLPIMIPKNGSKIIIFSCRFPKSEIVGGIRYDLTDNWENGYKGFVNIPEERKDLYSDALNV